MKTSNYRNTISRMASIATLLVLATPAVHGDGSMPEQRAVPRREDAAMVTMVAEVSAVSLNPRQVTLKDELGKEVTIPVGDAVKRLDEIKVGDKVRADYFLSVAFELREPTAEELANPLQVVEGAGRASKEDAPAGAVVSVMTAVCTIEGLDRPTETVTLMGPLGGLNVVKVRDVANLTKLRIGQPVVVTFTQAAAIGLEKVD